ncbi:uncharacterized protein PV09_03140 [Verruconis gallopava]|uniref:MOSC domain-containing protein n=1 Tax=Verruconis gallopava TaxID=253628 RepID=A0A0D1YZ30_9PEZI|nr:uncharacterized protein PV09_03140 [Verruconis gallopava]KIW05952.1 hypothetical protein PV09_03140 [Verruconis gallopava]
MSCPSSLKSAGEIFGIDEEPVDLPPGYYIYTALMIGLVIGIPLLYRQLWLVAWSLFRHFRKPPHLRGGPEGCRPVGRPGHRNLSKDVNQSPRGRGSAAASSNGQVKPSSGAVRALFVYPIKSCYPVEVDEAKITPMGFEHDRQFCFATWHEPSSTGGSAKSDAPKKGSSAYWDSTPHWEFMTQRQNPSLTHLRTQLWLPDEKLPDYDEESEVVKSGGVLQVSFEYSPPMTTVRNIWSVLHAKLSTLDLSAKPVWKFEVPLNPSAEQIRERRYGTDRVRIWRDEPSGINMTSEIPKYVLQNLRALLFDDIKRNAPHKLTRMKSLPELRLYRVDRSKDRELYKCAPKEEQLGYQSIIGYQDSYPIHLQNMATVADVDKQLQDAKAFTPDARRYRANIYVSGPPAYDEDDWTLVSIGDSDIHVSCRTTRCKLPTNDPDLGVLGSDNQPYAYLTKNRAIDEGAPNTGCLGMMAVPAKDSIGRTIKVGDALKVLKRGKHRFVADPEPEAQRPPL